MNQVDNSERIDPVGPHSTNRTEIPPKLERRRLPRRRRRPGSQPLSRAVMAASILTLLITLVAIAYSLKSLLPVPEPASQLKRSTTQQLSKPIAIQATAPLEINASPTSSTVSTAVDPEVTQEKARRTIEQWLQAKNKVFAPPFDQQILKRIATDQFLAKAQQSLHWLKQHKALYRYSAWKITKSSMVKDNQLTVTIEEQIELLGPEGRDRNSSGRKISTVTYRFRQEAGVWKIAQSEIR